MLNINQLLTTKICLQEQPEACTSRVQGASPSACGAEGAEGASPGASRPEAGCCGRSATAPTTQGRLCGFSTTTPATQACEG